MLERFPGLVLAAAVACGIWTRAASPPDHAEEFCAAALAVLAFGALVRQRTRTPLPQRVRPELRAALCFLIGFSRASPAVAPPPHRESPDGSGHRPVVVEGTIVEPPVQLVEDRDGIRAVTTRLTLESSNGAGRVAVAVNGRAPWLHGGQLVSAMGRLRALDGPANPGDLFQGDPGILFLSAPHPRCVRVLPRPAPGTAGALLGAVREAVHRVVEAQYSERMRGFVLAMVLGDRRLLAPDIRDALLYTGTFHLLAISGFHVTLVMFLALRIPLPRRAATLSRLLVLVGFTVLTGASPPVVRAAVMFALGILAERFRRKPEPLNTLGWSALILLGLDPAWLADPGFQLSFVAVASMLTWGARWSPRVATGRPLLDALRTSLAVSIGTSVGTAPILLSLFQRVHPLGPLWNLLAYPLTMVPLAGGSLAIALGLIHRALGAPVAWAVEQASNALIAPLALGARLPGSSLPFPPPGGFAVASCYALLVAGLRRSLRPPCFMAGAALLVFYGLAACIVPGSPEIWTFDVGQGDAGLLRVPRGGSFLVDAGAPGPDASAGSRLLRAVLATGTRSISGSFFTHPHADHLRGFEGLADRIRVSRIWVPPGFEDPESGRLALLAAAERGAPTFRLSRGWRIELVSSGGLSIDVLHPSQDPGPRGAARVNDDSLALRVTYRGSSILLLGDLEEDGLAALFASRLELRAGGLLAPHHGRTNALWPTLLERVRPRFVVISGSGDGGARSLAAWLESLGVRIFATWRRGAVRTVWKEGEGWSPAYWREE